MITIHASVVLCVRDGFTGKAMTPSALVCSLDGLPIRPIGKEGGYIVLTDLAAGPHKLTIRCRGYREEPVEFEADGGTREMDVTLKPGAGYPFRQSVTRLRVRVLEKNAPVAAGRLWLAAGQELKIAQAEAGAGEKELRVYCKGAVQPGAYLVEDGEKSEVVFLREAGSEKAVLSEPLQNAHDRGKRLLPAQSYHTDDEGTVTAVFRTSGKVLVFGTEKGLLGSLELIAGDNEAVIEL